MAKVFRARTLSTTRCFFKALIGDDHLLGFTAFGVEASELMAVVQTAVLSRLPYTVLGSAIWTHPMAAEGLLGLFFSLPATLAPEKVAATRIEGVGRQAAETACNCNGARHGFH